MLLYVLPVLALLIPMGAGAAGVPVLGFSGDSGDYGTVVPGTTPSPSQTFKLTNNGGVATGSLKVSIGAPGDDAAAFRTTGDSCSATSLGPKKFCSITVEYTPTGAGAHDDATLTVMSKKPAASKSLALTGQGKPANRAPVAGPNSYVTDQNSTLTLPAPGVLIDDTDPDGDVLSVATVRGSAANVGAQVTLPSGALLTMNVDGSFSYDPNGAFDYLPSGMTATDNATYTATDGLLESNLQNLIVTVQGRNDAPVAVNDSVTTDEDTPLNSSSVLANDIDPDAGAVLSVAQVNGSVGNVGTQITLASGALLTVNANGTSSYNPNGAFELLHGGQQALDSFTYAATDGQGGLATATVNVTVAGVNDAPVAVNDSYNVVAGETLTVPAPGVLANDTDAEHDPLAALFKFGSDPHGVFSLNLDGSFDYTPDAGFTGTDTFFYTADDGHFGLSNTGTITINVTAPINHAPVAVDDNYNVGAGNTLTVPASLGVLANDTDVDGDAWDVKFMFPQHGTLKPSADGSFEYTPDAGFTGIDSFTYSIRDPGGLESFATVRINVMAAVYKVSFNLSGGGEMSFATLSDLADAHEDCRGVSSLPTCSTFLASGSPARVDLVSGDNRLGIEGRPFHYTCPGGSPQPAELFQASPGANINYTGRCETEFLSGDFAVIASFDLH
jgi:VCBS repeat-containing protein